MTTTTPTIARLEKWARLRKLIDRIGMAALYPDIEYNGVNGHIVNTAGVDADYTETMGLARELEWEEAQQRVSLTPKLNKPGPMPRSAASLTPKSGSSTPTASITTNPNKTERTH
jgi:hypothetical protein